MTPTVSFGPNPCFGNRRFPLQHPGAEQVFQIVGLSPHQLDLIFCCGTGLLKLVVILFFFIP